MPDSPEVQAQIIAAHGLDPLKYEMSPDGTQILPKSALAIQQPTQESLLGNKPIVTDKDFEDSPVQVAPTLQGQDSPIITAGRSALDAAPSMAAGGVGAAGGMALLNVLAKPALAYPPVGIPLNILVGLGSAYAASKGVRAAQTALEPEEYKKKLQESQAANPVAAELGEVAAMPLGGFNASPSNLVRAGGTLGKVVTGLEKSPEELANLLNVGTGTVIGAAQPLAEGDYNPADLLKNAAEGALFNKPNAIGRNLGFSDHQRILSDPEKVRQMLLAQQQEQIGIPAADAVNPAPATLPDVQTTIGGIPIKQDVRTEDTTKEGKAANAMATYRMDKTPESQMAAMEAEGGVNNDPELVAQRNAEEELRRRVTALPANPQRAADFIRAKGEEAVQTIQEQLQNEKDLQTRQLGQELQQSGIGSNITRPETIKGKTPFSPFAKDNKAVATDEVANAADLAGRQKEQELAGIPKNEQDKFQETGRQPILTEAGKMLQEQAHSMGLDVSKVTPELFNTWAKEISALHGIKDTAIEGEAPFKGTAHVGTQTTDIFTKNADAGTQAHENFHHIFDVMPDRAKQQLLLATKPEFDAYNAERVKAGKQPFDHEEYLATQFGYKAISRLINAHNETPLKGWWNDTKSLWKAKYGAEPSVDDLYRANTYKLVNGISELPKGGMKGAGTGAVSKNQEVDKEGNQVPLNRTGKEEEEYRRVTQEAQKKDEQKGWFKKMHEAVQRNQEGEEGITKPTKELKTGQVTRGKLTYEQRRQQQGELRTKQREEMETIRNGAPAREAGRAPLSYPVDETGYVPPRNAPPRRIPANLQDSDVPIINNVVRAKLSRMLLRAGLPSHVTNKETGKSGKFMPEETIKDIVGKVQQSLIKDGLDMKAGRVPTSNAVSGIERRGADIEHPDAVAKTDMVAQSAGRRAQEFFKEWLEEQKTLKKTSSLDQSAGEGRTQHDVLAGAQHAEGNETAELEQKTTHKENPIEEIPSKINEKFDTTNGELAGMLEGMQERFGDDRFSEHIAKLDAMPEGTQLDSKSWIEKNIPKEDLRHQDKEEGIQSKEIFTTKAQQLIKNPKSGQLNSGKAFNGNQLLGVLKNNLSPVEWDILQKAGIEKEFGGGRNVSQQDASQWVQEHTPKVEVHTYGMEGKVSEAKREYDRMTHEWYDNEPVSVRTKIDEAITRPNSNQLLHDYISNGARRSGGNLWTLRQTPEWKAKAERYLELAKQVGMEDTSGGPKATSYYSTVSAFDTTQPMPEWTTTKSGRNVQRVDVVIPLKGELSANDVRSAHKLGGWKETQDKGLMWPPDDLHENLPNTLGWAMIQYKTGPKGEKIAVIAEAQSRWGQERRKLEQDAKDNNRVGVLQTLGGKDAVENHSLLRDYNRLILKAAIEQARKEGATHIMVSDAETAMMTERHDAQGYEINRYQDKNGKIHESREGPNTQYGHYLLSQGMKWVEKTHSPINQEPGMRLNYDTILPKIAEELTGSKGEKVSLGEHKNAYETKVIRERQRPDTGGEMPEVTDQVERSNLIFRNADGTPKTSVTGRMYPLEAVGHKLDSGDSFTLFNKHQDKEEGITPEQKFNFLHLMPAIDKARHLSGPEGKPVADVFQKFPTIRDEFYGKYSNKLLTLADKMPVADRNYVHNWLMKEDLDQKSYASMMNSPAKKALYEATREALKQKQLDQIKDGQQVRDFDAKGKPFMRDAQVNPFYYPSVLRPDVLDAILNHTGDYKRYQNMLLEHWGGVNNPNAIAKLESLKAAGDSSKPNATRFGANRLTEGAGLPAELRVKDYGKTISKYFNKVATDRAWFNLVEKNPEVNKAIQPDNSQGVYHEFKNIIEQIKGEPFDHDAGVIRAFNKVFTSALLGPMTNIHIGWSTIFNPFQYLKATELATAYPKALANWGEAAEKIYQNGYKRRDLNSLADITDSQSTFINRMQAISSLIGKVNGREWTDRVSKTFAQALGEQIVPLRIEGAKQGDKWSQKMIMQLDPSWSKDKVYSKEEIASMASSLGGLIHGAHDYRTLPEFMTRESIIKPFLSLQSWSVSQTNQWMKHVWEPATQGNIQPLLMSTLGAAVGGYVIQQLRQQMMDKKSNIPSLTEIAKSSKGLEGNIPLLAYNFMQMASFTGMMGIGSSLGKMAFDTAYKNIPQSATFPLDEAVTNIGKTITEAVSAFQQNPTADNFLKIFPQAMIDLAKENVQTARIADNWMSDKGVSTQTENYKYKLNTSEQDLRRFKMAEGMPYDQQTETSNNPYLNMEQKNFKRTTDIGEAAKEVPDLVALAQERAAGNPEILKNQLNTLKQNSYQTMPSPENMPLQYAKYYQYLVKTIGPEAAQQRVADYMRQNTINKMKESMIPSMR